VQKYKLFHNIRIISGHCHFVKRAAPGQIAMVDSSKFKNSYIADIYWFVTEALRKAVLE
jgi:hypothetical protein